MRERREPWPWIVGAGAALFYLCFHSSFYNFDGVACAISVELGDFRHLLHSNHMAYGPAAWLFDRLWRLAGYEGRALLALQSLDSLLGGLGVGLFCRLLLRLGLPARLSALAAVALTVSQAWWMWSLEAQVYMLGAVLLLGAAGEALSERPDPIRLGLWHAAAILGHIGHGMFLPAAVYCLGRATGPRRRVLVRYALALAAVLVPAYVVAGLVIGPKTLDELRIWLLGSAALPVDRSFQWHYHGMIVHPVEWAASTLRIFVIPSGGLAAAAAGWLLAALPIAAAAAAYRLAPGRRRLVTACGLWILGYFLLYSSWQPPVLVYRVTDLAPLWLLAALCLERLRESRSALLLAGWALAAGTYNRLQALEPHLDARNNIEYREAMWLGAVAPEGAWIVASGRAQVYVPYFAHRRPLNLRYYEHDFPSLARRVDAIRADGGEALVTGSILEAGAWGSDLKAYGLEELRREGDLVLYRLRRKGSRAAAGGRS